MRATAGAFAGESEASLITAILGAEPPALLTLQPLMPRLLDHVVRGGINALSVRTIPAAPPRKD